MGWLERWREARAEAAVRRRLVAAARRGGAFVVEQNPPAGYDPEPMTPLWPPGTVLPVRTVALVDNIANLLAACDQADAIAGRHGGFVTTAKIRELLGGDR
jgi:hypothetical protein